MGWRLRRSISLGKGVRLNVSRSGIGISAGVKGFRVGVGPRGAYRTISIPGTGLSHTAYAGHTSKSNGVSMAADTNNAPSGTGTPVIVPDPDVPSALASGSPGSGCLFAVALLFGIGGIISGTGGGIAIGAIGVVIAVAIAYQSNATPKAQALRLFRQGLVSLRQNNVDRAIASFIESDKVVPLAATRKAVAGAYIKKGYFNDAAEWYRKAVEADPSDIEARLCLADSLSQTERYQEALEVLQDLPREIRQELPIIIDQALCFMGMKKYDLALSILETGPMLKRNMEPPMITYRYLLGVCYQETGNKRKAINQLKRVYAQDMHYQDVAERLQQLGALDAAVAEDKV